MYLNMLCESQKNFIPPRAHSTRKIGASMAFLGNIPISDIQSYI